MRPPFAYYGGKIKLANRIVDLLPPHRVYIEPCAGSLAVLFAKAPAVHEIVNDVDDAIVTFFRILRDRRAELEEACALTPHARAEFAAAEIGEEGLDDLERARRFWVRVNQSFAKSAGSRTGWSVTTDRTQAVAASIRARLGRFAAAAERLAGCTIEQRDAADLVDRMATADSVVYVDPPYLAGTRVARTSGTRGDYRHEMSTEDHHRLADVLRSTKAAVVLSGYPSPLYDELYPDWWTCDFAVKTSSSNAGTRSYRTERLWANRELDTQGRLPWVASISDPAHGHFAEGLLPHQGVIT